jgi:hypothetical protein
MTCQKDFKKCCCPCHADDAGKGTKDQDNKAPSVEDLAKLIKFVNRNGEETSPGAKPKRRTVRTIIKEAFF